jgi:hypothetical protein
VNPIGDGDLKTVSVPDGGLAGRPLRERFFAGPMGSVLLFLRFLYACKEEGEKRRK